MAKDIMKSRVGGPGKKAHVPQVHPVSGEPRQIIPDGSGHRSHGIQPDHGINTKHFLGKPPKPKAEHSVVSHPGMAHFDRESGLHVTDFSSTQVAQALGGYKDPTVPAPRDKPLPPAKAAFGQRSRTNNGALGSDEMLNKLGRAILEEGTRLDPTHPRHFGGMQRQLPFKVNER
jgi:hypothetical protein